MYNYYNTYLHMILTYTVHREYPGCPGQALLSSNCAFSKAVLFKDSPHLEDNQGSAMGLNSKYL